MERGTKDGNFNGDHFGHGDGGNRSCLHEMVKD